MTILKWLKHQYVEAHKPNDIFNAKMKLLL